MNYSEKTPKQKLIDKIYKLLPIYEGKLMGTDERIEPNKAYTNFQNNINMLILQLMGSIRRTGKTEHLEDVLILLEGLKTVGIDNHSIVKKSIFSCVKQIEKLEDDYGNDI